MSTRKNIVGNLATDIELKFGQTGKAWAQFAVISNEGKDDKATKTVTRCKLFGDAAENAAESLPKGTRVIIAGREVTEEWDSNGEKRSANVTIVDALGPDLRFATAKVTRSTKSTGSTGGFGNAYGFAPTPSTESDPWANVPASDEPPF